jgi:hypothetical protein
MRDRFGPATDRGRSHSSDGATDSTVFTITWVRSVPGPNRSRRDAAPAHPDDGKASAPTSAVHKLRNLAWMCEAGG